MGEKALPPQKWKKCCSYVGAFLGIKFILFPLVIFLAIVIWKAATKPNPTPVISTSDGPVQGNIRYSRSGQEYWEFLGIPYAMPPTGERLFKPPVPVKPWEGIKQVTSFPPDCTQFEPLLHSYANGYLDCLYLNVFVNVANGNRTKPVLVFIFGGAYVAGGTYQYQPDYLMDEDIVLVIMNYRLGPYGFLNLQDETGEIDKTIAQGNMALKDQNLVLHWIQTNIGQFMGDPNKVTLFGQSAGAAIVHSHLLSPMSRGLFHRAILQSGSALAQWTHTNRPKDRAIENAKMIGCPNVMSNKAILECYKNTDPKKVLKQQYTLLEPFFPKHVHIPSVDGTFLKKKPKDILKSGKFPAIPIMLGVNSGEGGVRSSRFDIMPELIPELDKNWTNLMDRLLFFEETLSSEVCMEIRDYYFGNKTFTEDIPGFLGNLTKMATDPSFFYSSHKSAIYHAKNGAPTFMYYFNYTSNDLPGFYIMYRAARRGDWLPVELKLVWTGVVDWVKVHVFGGKSDSRQYGICHGEDLAQLWNAYGVSKYLTKSDEEFSRSFVKAIVDFANATEPLTFRGMRWPSINAHLDSGKNEFTIPYMLLDNEKNPKVISEPFGSRTKFWSQLDQNDI